MPAVAPRIWLALLALALPATAAEFNVNPTRVELGPRQAAETLVIGNGEDRPISFEVEVKRWTQGVDGAWQLTPSDELVVHPLLVTVPAQGKARLRVGTLQRRDEPRAWRVELQQLPEARAAEGASVQILTRLSIPVFAQPARAVPRPQLQMPEVEAGAVRVRLANVGNTYLPPQDAHLRLLDAAGRVVHETPIAPGYVLAGAQLPLARPLPAGVCSRAARLELRLTMPATTLAAEIPAAARRCGG